MLLQLYPQGKWHPLFMVWQDGCNPVVFYHMQNAPIVFNGFENWSGSQQHVQCGGQEKNSQCPWQESLPGQLCQILKSHTLGLWVLRRSTVKSFIVSELACSVLCFCVVGCDDHGTWGMAEWQDNACRQEGFLSLVSLCNGAMGWTSTSHFHGWTLYWCHFGQVRWILKQPH